MLALWYRALCPHAAVLSLPHALVPSSSLCLRALMAGIRCSSATTAFASWTMSYDHCIQSLPANADMANVLGQCLISWLHNPIHSAVQPNVLRSCVHLCIPPPTRPLRLPPRPHARPPVCTCVHTRTLTHALTLACTCVLAAPKHDTKALSRAKKPL